MGIFEGFLICSDMDGTFNGSETIISVNKKAVQYFIENGGKFTFCTGRNVAYFSNSQFSDIINAPVALLNGSVIYDYNEERVLYEKPVSFSISEFAEELSVRGYSESDMIVSAYHGCDGSVLSFGLNNIPQDMLAIKPLKLVCRFTDLQKADEFKNFISNLAFFKDCYIAKSWSTGVEINSLFATKGTAVHFIKDHLKDVHISVGVGNYENDIPLILQADIGVSVGNGLEEVKEAADIIVKKNDEFAIADLIEMLRDRLVRENGPNGFLKDLLKHKK